MAEYFKVHPFDVEYRNSTLPLMIFYGTNLPIPLLCAQLRHHFDFSYEKWSGIRSNVCKIITPAVMDFPVNGH